MCRLLDYSVFGGVGFLVGVFVCRGLGFEKLGVEVRVSHIWPKAGQIWGALRFFDGTELEGRVFCWDRIALLEGLDGALA
jgi:hypothetical protein